MGQIIIISSFGIDADPASILSDGMDVVFAGIYYDEVGDPYPAALGSPVVSCHDGDMTWGAIDWDWSGEIDAGEELASVVAELPENKR